MKIQHRKSFCIGCRKHMFLVSKTSHLCVECNHKRQHINTLRDNTKSETQSILTLKGIEIPKREKTKMNLKDKTEAYVPPTTKNIVDLDKISIDIDLTTNTYTKKDSEEPFTVDEFEVEGAKYRMPTSVIAQLKVLMTEITDLKFFKVTKTGMGLDTKYFVIPLKE